MISMQESRKQELEQELKKQLRGEVLFDEMSRLLYSTDASLYQIKPLGVVIPRTKDDIRRAVLTAARYQVPVLPRGGGTSLAGQAVSRGLVIDCSRHFNRVLRINREQGWVDVEPGIVLDNLNRFLAFHGYFFAPDVATSSRANIGGMIGNNSCGVRSIRYGKTVDHVLSLSVLLSDGEEVRLGPLSSTQLESLCKQPDRIGQLHATVRQIVSENRAEILRRYPRVMRRVGGYNLDLMLEENGFNLARLMVGSEGTLGFVTEARLRILPIPACRALAVLHFSEVLEAVESVRRILKYEPTAVEILDEYGLKLARNNSSVAELCSHFIKNSPEAILIVEFSREDESDLGVAMEALAGDSFLSQRVFHTYRAYSDVDQQRIWQVRKSALGVMLGIKGDAKPLPFIEDACVPVEHLRDYIAELQDICKAEGRRVAMYAHASVGVIHVRPILNLKKAEDLAIMQRISEKTFELVRRFEGAWSGEHGDGLVRSYKNREFFGEQLYESFRRVKHAFDPSGLMNPGKIVDASPMTENLRIHPGYTTQLPKTFYRFEEEQGFDRAIEMCTGVGHCRKTLGGTMCPSFMATRDEEDSTRGRANALRSAIAGDLGLDGLASPRLYQVLDLCLECKACKSECPSGVDMARLKSEFLAHYYEKHPRPLGKRLTAATRSTAMKAQMHPRLFNFMLQNRWVRLLLEKLAGLDRRRQLPRFSQNSFCSHLRKLPVAAHQTEADVVLFIDTFTDFYEPEIGISAVHLLHRLGIRPWCFTQGCCQRPLISAGLLDKARTQGASVLRHLAPSLKRKVPIIVLEPSCYATLADDFPDLLEDRDAAHQLGSCIQTIEEFVSKNHLQEELRRATYSSPGTVVLHGHCQQKALIGTSATAELLRCLPNSQVEVLDAGCCGMAGSFGYEKSHYAISEKIGGQRLFPRLRKLEDGSLIAASGFSCRAQIRHFTDREALHPAEILANRLLDRSGSRAIEKSSGRKS